MTKRKICLIGSFSVGKTSLTRRFVSNEFSDDYLTTMGVKIERRDLVVDGVDISLMIWDIAGRDEFARVRSSYLVGAAGYLFVADGTRKETVGEMLEEAEDVREKFGDVPAIVLVNKADLSGEWELDDETLQALDERFTVFKTSALTGVGVEEAFIEISRRMLESEVA